LKNPNSYTQNPQVADRHAGCLLCPSGSGNFCLCQILPFLHDDTLANTQIEPPQQEEIDLLLELIKAGQ